MDARTGRYQVFETRCSARSRLGVARQRVRLHPDLLQVREGGGGKTERERVCVCATHMRHRRLDGGFNGKCGDEA